MASRPPRAKTVAVLVTVQVCALLGAFVVAAIAGGDPHAGDFAFGALGGVLNVGALGCLYQGLAVGRAGVVAPIAAVVGAVIPVVWGLASGENPANAALVGVALAVVAGGLISVERPEHPTADAGGRSALVLALLAGVGFGFSFVCYGNTRDASEFWPVLSGRIGAVTAVVLVAASSASAPRSRGTARVQAVAAGLLDVGADRAAARRGAQRPVRDRRARSRRWHPRSPSVTRGGTCASDRRRSRSQDSSIALDRTRADRGQRIELTPNEKAVTDADTAPHHRPSRPPRRRRSRADRRARAAHLPRA